MGVGDSKWNIFLTGSIIVQVVLVPFGINTKSPVLYSLASALSIAIDILP